MPRRRVRPGHIVDAALVASMLGVHMRTVQRWVARGHLKAHRLGGFRSKLRIRRKDLRAFLVAEHPRGITRMVAQAMLSPGERQRPSAWRRQAVGSAREDQGETAGEDVRTAPRAGSTNHPSTTDPAPTSDEPKPG